MPVQMVFFSCAFFNILLKFARLEWFCKVKSRLLELHCFLFGEINDSSDDVFCFQGLLPKDDFIEYKRFLVSDFICPIGHDF